MGKWTTERPAKVGFYFMRRDPESEAMPVRVATSLFNRRELVLLVPQIDDDDGGPAWSADDEHPLHTLYDIEWWSESLEGPRDRRKPKKAARR